MMHNIVYDQFTANIYHKDPRQETDNKIICFSLLSMFSHFSIEETIAGGRKMQNLKIDILLRITSFILYIIADKRQEMVMIIRATMALEAKVEEKYGSQGAHH